MGSLSARVETAGDLVAAGDEEFKAKEGDFGAGDVGFTVEEET